MTKKPHIAMILPDKIEHPVGGMGVQAKYLIKHLENEFDFSVHGFPDNTSLPYYHSVFNPLPKVQHGSLNTLTGQVTYLASIMAMIEKGTKPDLIHVTDYTEYFAGMYASKALGIPLVTSMQLSVHLMNQTGLRNAYDPKSQDGHWIETSLREMELQGLQEAHHIIHVSNEYKKIFSQIPNLDKKSTFIPNGVDLEEFADEAPGYKPIQLPGKGRLKIVYIGRIAPQKNVDNLLQVYIPGDIDLIFVGEKSNANPATLERLHQKMSQHKNIHFLGAAYDQDKINILKSADAVIIPSLHECHPIVMHEAMAAGCVVIHSGAGDMKKVLTPDFSIYCGITPESIDNAIQILRSLSADEIIARKKRGLEVVKEYTWKKAAEKTKDVYLNLLKKS